MNKKAFTLSEVLITLTVIGVVAALAIPILVKDTNKAEYKVALKKQYAEATQVLKKIAYDRGGTLAGYSSLTVNSILRANDFKDMVLPYVSSVKNCNTDEGNGGSAGGCKLNDSEVFNYDGTAYGTAGSIWGRTNKATIVLNNGAIWYFFNYSTAMGNCSDNPIASGPYKNKSCGLITIDTNGLKAPNKTTYDIFEFYIAEDGTLIPLGSDFDKVKDTISTNRGYNPLLIDMLTN